MAQDIGQTALPEVAVADIERRQEEAGADYEVGLESLSQWQLGVAEVQEAPPRAGRPRDPRGPVARSRSSARSSGRSTSDDIPRPDQIVPIGRPPSLAHPFGETGGLQRDVFTLVINGARTSLFIGFGSMLHRRASSARSSARSRASSAASPTTS